MSGRDPGNALLTFRRKQTADYKCGCTVKDTGGDGPDDVRSACRSGFSSASVRCLERITARQARVKKGKLGLILDAELGADACNPSMRLVGSAHLILPNNHSEMVVLQGP